MKFLLSKRFWLSTLTILLIGGFTIWWNVFRISKTEKQFIAGDHKTTQKDLGYQKDRPQSSNLNHSGDENNVPKEKIKFENIKEAPRNLSTIDIIYKSANHTFFEKIALAETISDYTKRLKAFHFILKQWVHSDPYAAISWTMKHGAGNTRFGLLTTISLAWAAVSHQEAAEWASSLNLGGDRNHVISNITKKWAESDPMSALSWADQLKKEEGREYAVRSIVRVWAKSDFNTAKTWAEQNVESISATSIISQILSVWVERILRY